MIDEGWKEHVVFTPDHFIEPQQIYEIDKFLYACKHQPISSIVCILSFMALIVIIISWARTWFRITLKTM